MTTDWTLVEQLTPLLSTNSEQNAWLLAGELCEQLFDGELTAGIEFVSDDRAVLVTSVGLPGPFHSEPFPVAPDSQAAFVRSSALVCISNDILIDQRFQAPALLTNAEVRSTMSASFPLGEHGCGLIGVYSRRCGAFADADPEALGLLARVLGLVIGRIRIQEQLQLDAQVDALTGLNNRASVLAELAHRLRNEQEVTALTIGLDGFKSINDEHGHELGDVVLQVVAARLERVGGVNDCLGRLGGDEFMLLLDGFAGPLRAEQIIGLVEETIMIDTSAVSLSASVGVARSRTNDTAASMLERADQMLSTAKAGGRGQVRTDRTGSPNTSAPTSESSARRSEPALDLAMIDNAIAGLGVVVQPIVRASTGSIFGVEALTRGPAGHPLEYPDRLFDAATTLGRLGPLELAAKRLSFDLDIDDTITLFINLDPSLLSDPEWFEQLADAWRSSGSGRPVVAELTERCVMEHPGRLLAAVDACRQLGWKIALDDVGSRSESLAAMRWIEPDIVKLDMRLIRNDNPAHSAHVVAAVAAYRNQTRRNDVIVIAEGVETQADEDHADVLGADLLQGYRCGRPGPVDDLAHFALVDTCNGYSRSVPHLGERIGTKADLLSMTRHIEAAAVAPDCMLLSTLQDASHFTARTRHQYRALARRCGFVGVLGADVTTVPASEVTGVHLADLDLDDELVETWQVLAMSPTTSIGLLATELGTNGGADDMNRLFRYRFISETTDVEDAVRRLLRHF
ncbi:MAG: EAL domain-containing protein [Ilumatobacter sp.]